MLFPKVMNMSQLGERNIYRGFTEEGEGQFPIAKTRDWVEEDLHGINGKMGYATLLGLKASAVVALVDIMIIKRIKDRRAQIARFAYFTIPLTTMAAGWMGGVEIGKLALGRDSEVAHLAGATVPGGIVGIWTKNIYGGMRTALFLGLWGAAYQYSCNNNLTNSVFLNSDNPNIPQGRFETQTAFFWPTKEGHSTLSETLGLTYPDPGPSWKKWEDVERKD